MVNNTVMKLTTFCLFLLFLLVSFSVFSTTTTSSRKDGRKRSLKRVCYLVADRTEVDLIQPSEMRWGLCSHVIFSFVTIVETNLQPNPIIDHYMLSMNSSRPSNVKALFSVGNGFSFAKNQTLIEKFCDSVLAFCDKYRLDGIDIDWEFPSYTHDKEAFSNLLLSLRKRFDLELFRTGKEILLTVALTPILYIVDQSYDMKVVDRSVSFVNLMTYDYHTPNTLIYTNYNAPLYPTKYDLWYFKYFNVDYSVRMMLNKGLSRDKVVLGIPFYGYLYYLANPAYNSVFSLTNGTQESISYLNVCRLLSGKEYSSWKLPGNTTETFRVFDADAKVPYLYSGSKWITFDDQQSVTIKSQWIVDQQLGGAMIFALNYDDVRGECHSEGAFPLQQTVTDVLL